MQFEGAIVIEQGVTFGIVIVKPHVLSSTPDQIEARSLGARAFGRIPIILMAQDEPRGADLSGTPGHRWLSEQDCLPANPLEEVHPLIGPRRPLHGIHEQQQRPRRRSVGRHCPDHAHAAVDLVTHASCPDCGNQVVLYICVNCKKPVWPRRGPAAA